jgi:hypothetical protein
VHLPRPVEMRLEGTRARPDGAGTRPRPKSPTRGEVVGTLLLTRNADDALVADLRHYRNASVGQVLPGRARVTLSPRRRGRPPLRPR